MSATVVVIWFCSLFRLLLFPFANILYFFLTLYICFSRFPYVVPVIFGFFYFVLTSPICVPRILFYSWAWKQMRQLVLVACFDIRWVTLLTSIFLNNILASMGVDLRRYLLVRPWRSRLERSTVRACTQGGCVRGKSVAIGELRTSLLKTLIL